MSYWIKASVEKKFAQNATQFMTHARDENGNSASCIFSQKHPPPKCFLFFFFLKTAA